MTRNFNQLLFLVIYGIYCIVIGWLNLKSNIRMMDFISFIAFLLLRISKGKEAADEWKKELLQSYKYDTIARFFFYSGVFFLLLAIYTIIRML
ncbi:MAG: hypothetical protein ACTSO6_08230 [Promethearchaeota archaeon]